MINDLLSTINDNYYTSDEDKDENFMVVISNISDWYYDGSGFNSLLCITEVVQIDNRVVLSTIPFIFVKAVLKNNVDIE